MPAQPRITLLAPKTVMAQKPTDLLVRLDSPRATDIDFVDLFLDANHFGTAGSSPMLRLGARLRERSRLPKGRTDLECRIEIPEGLPASYEGLHFRFRYEVRVHVSVPFWPDARRAFQLFVASPARMASPQGALLFSSRDGGAPVSGPYAEVSLASRSLAAGDVLRGAVALYNVASCNYQKVTVSIRQRERAPGVDQPGRAWSIELAPPPFAEGQPIDFALRVPALAPSMSFRGLEVSHEVVVDVRGGWRDLLSMPIPIEVLPQTTGDAGRSMAAPALGEKRVHAIWERVATSTGFRLEGESLRRDLGSNRVSVRRDLSKGSPRLLAELTFQSLGLGLKSEESSFFRAWLPSRLTTGIERIDHPLLLDARSPEQATPFVRRWAQALLPLLSERVQLVEISDDKLALAIDDSGTTEDSIVKMVELATELAEVSVNPLSSVPLPTDLADIEDGWRALSARLGADLQTGSGMLSFEDGDALLTVRPLFDARGAVQGLRVSRVEPSPLAIPKPLFISKQEALTVLNREARSAAERLLERATELSLSADELIVTDPHPDRSAWVARTDSTLSDLRRLASALRGSDGPFR